MKYFWIGFAIIAVTLGLFSVFLFGFALRSTGVIGRDAERYTRAELPIVVQTWNAERLAERASPEMLQRMPPADMATLMAGYAERFGPLRTLGDVKCDRLEDPHAGADERFMVAHVVARAEFREGPARIQWRLIRRQAKWQITELTIEADRR